MVRQTLPALGAFAIDHQLLTQDLRSRWRIDPRKGLLRQAGHLATLQAKEVDVVTTAPVGGAVMPTKTPHTVDTLDSMQQTSLLQCGQSPVKCNSGETADFGAVGDFLV